MVSGISEEFQGFPRSSIGYQGVLGVSKGFLEISDGFQGVLRGFRWFICFWIDILKNTSDLLTYLLTNEAKSRDAVASKNTITDRIDITQN